MSVDEFRILSRIVKRFYLEAIFNENESLLLSIRGHRSGT